MIKKVFLLFLFFQLGFAQKVISLSSLEDPEGLNIGPPAFQNSDLNSRSTLVSEGPGKI